MNEPRRLWQDAEASPALRAAMQAGREDKAVGRRLAAMAAGLAAAGLPMTQATATTFAVVAKIAVVVAAVGGAVGVAALAQVQRINPASTHAPQTVPAIAATVAAPAAATPRVAPDEPVPAQRRPPTVARKKVSVSAARATPMEESLWLEDVRKSLASDPNQALKQLATYNRRFPDAVLDQEAAVMRVQALAATKHWQQAKVEGERFLRRHPTSPHRSRVLRALEQSQ